jgi:hypothetical protein
VFFLDFSGENLMPGLAENLSILFKAMEIFNLKDLFLDVVGDSVCVYFQGWNF